MTTAVSQRQQDIARIVRDLVRACAVSQHDPIRIGVLGMALSSMLSDDLEATLGIVAGITAALRPDLAR